VIVTEAPFTVEGQHAILEKMLRGFFMRRMPFRLVDDAIQETLAKCLAAEKRNRALDPENPRPINLGYVIRAAKSVWHDQWSSERGYASLDEMQAATGYEPASRVLPQSNPEYVLSLLTHTQQRAAILRDIGYSLAEIAIMEHTTVDGVKALLYRARCRIRAEEERAS
jgi:DNA-directed RNA polymerase specialized sigma24 family protein